jgi:hypothetical protein
MMPLISTKPLAKLAKYRAYGDLDDLMEKDGTIKKTRKADVIKARDWLEAALEVRSCAPQILPISVAIPTWLYGAEPTMPFATHYAKYYQNSLREEALVNNSRAGIIYGQGGGGTMRKVFQDVERNYSSKSVDDFTPMVFYDIGLLANSSCIQSGKGRYLRDQAGRGHPSHFDAPGNFLQTTLILSDISTRSSSVRIFQSSRAY